MWLPSIQKPTRPDFGKNRWVQGVALSKFPQFSPFWQNQAPDSLSWHPRPSQPLPSFLADQLPPQHHEIDLGCEIDFGLTHKAISTILYQKKSDFLLI
jgi:hypothetical protein